MVATTVEPELHNKEINLREPGPQFWGVSPFREVAHRVHHKILSAIKDRF